MYVCGIGICAPGLENWHQALAVLRDEQSWEPAEFKFPPPERLPRNERRRATPLTRLAFAACEDALRDYQSATTTRCIFASCSGDMDVIDGICRALAQEEIALSPMQFHNSVHNAPAGYWSIARGDRQASISLSAFDSTLAAGLQEALMQLHDDPDSPVLLVAYDVATKPPMASARDVSQPFACALVLSEKPEHAIARLSLSRVAAADETQLAGALSELHQTNPAAKALPLLSLLAGPRAGQVRLPAGAASLSLAIEAV